MKSTGRSSLGVLLDDFMRAMHRYDAGRTLPLLHAAKLTTPQIAALEFTREPQTISAVATYLGLSRPATSQLIDKLVRGHLLLRTEGATDRRERNVVLSANGRSLVDRIASARAARFEASLSVLPAALAARFSSILDEVTGVLAEAAKPAGDGQSHGSGTR